MRGGPLLTLLALALGAGLAAWALLRSGPAARTPSPTPASAPASVAESRPRARPPELGSGSETAPSPAPAPAPAPTPSPAPPVPDPLKPAAAPRWTTYRTSVQGGANGTPIEITVDLAAKPSAPDPAHPQLLQITIQMLEPDPSGLRDLGADSQLDAITAALRDELAPALGARYVGRVRREGTESHFLYCPAAAQLDTAHEALERRFDRHTWFPFAQDDASWTSYLELLYPSQGENGPSQGENGR